MTHIQPFSVLDRESQNRVDGAAAATAAPLFFASSSAHPEESSNGSVLQHCTMVNASAREMARSFSADGSQKTDGSSVSSVFSDHVVEFSLFPV